MFAHTALFRKMFFQLFMALLWAIHTLLMIFVYRELKQVPQSQSALNDDDDDECFEKEIEDGSGSNTSSPTHARTRDRAPSRFFSYVSNG